MNTYSHIHHITGIKRLRKGHLITFSIQDDLFGYAVILNEFGTMWLLDFYSDSQIHIPNPLPYDRCKWRVSHGFAKINAWTLGQEKYLPIHLTDPYYIHMSFMGPQLLGPDTVRIATKEDFKKFPINHMTNDITDFAREHLHEMEKIKREKNWTPISLENLLKAASNSSRPKPTGNRYLHVFVSSFTDTLIIERGDLEKDIQEAIGEEGFVSGGGSLVGRNGEEGGYIEVECDDATFTSVLKAIAQVLIRLKVPGESLLVDAVLLDDGTATEKEFALSDIRLASD